MRGVYPVNKQTNKQTEEPLLSIEKTVVDTVNMTVEQVPICQTRFKLNNGLFVYLPYVLTVLFLSNLLVI